MKNENNILILFISTLLISLLFISCEVKSPTEGLEVRINSKERETMVTAHIVDATSGFAIEQNVNIRFSGDNASKIIDEVSNGKTEFSANSGFFTFAVADGVSIFPEKPFTVIANIESAGYTPVSIVVSLDSAGFQQITLPMSKPNSFGNNFVETKKVSGKANENGVLIDSVNIATEDGFEIKLTPGAIFTDDDGNPVTGEITTTLTTIKISDETESILPADLRVNDDDIIEPLMAVSFDLSGENGAIANISGSESDSIEISIPYDEEFSNPETGTPFTEGDKLEVWYVDENTGELKQDGTVELVNEEFSVTSKYGNTIKHRGRSWRYRRSYSYYSYYYRYYRYNRYYRSYRRYYYYSYRSQRCTKRIKISNPKEGNSVQVFYGNRRYRTLNTSYQTQFSFYGYRYRSYNFTFKQSANYYGNGGTSLGSISHTRGQCGTKYVTLNWPVNTVDIAVYLQAKICSGQMVYPYTNFQYREKGSFNWSAGAITFGWSWVSGLKPNSIYEIAITFDGFDGRAEVRINADGSPEILQSNGKIISTEIGNRRVRNGRVSAFFSLTLDACR